MSQKELEPLDGTRNAKMNFPRIELFESFSGRHIRLGALSDGRHNE